MAEMKPMWTPSPERVASSRMRAFAEFARRDHGLPDIDWPALHAWSIEQPTEFWSAVWAFCGVRGDLGQRVLLDGERMPGARWFPDARLNFAENLLRQAGHGDALVFWGEDRVRRHVSHDQLRTAVAQCAAALRAEGVVAGDRVAALLPNLPETIVAMLACASLGAVFTSASPDFGVQGVLDRFGQVEPKVLFACDAYWYDGKRIDCLAKLRAIAPQLRSLARVVVVPYAGAGESIPPGESWLAWDDFLAARAAADAIDFAPLPFDHPLFILYSSGTTGVPKCIVHGTGGTLLQHLKEHQLHGDIRPGDRLFYFTTCGWMMWNWLVSGLASGATLILYDGSPFADGGRILWRLAEAERITHFGTSAKYIDALSKSGLTPCTGFDVAALRTIFSTGSPLAAESFDFVHRAIKADVQLASISGGTDIISCFVLGNPLLPVWRGEIQCRGLGMAVDVFDASGNPVRGAKGELVCTRPFPSMPVGFWNDADGSRYRAAYFERFPGVWCHGDYCEVTEHDGLIIHGRSDATLNPGGVRIGTAEIYRQVDTLPEVLESIVIGQAWPPERRDDVRIVLFVKLREGMMLDDALRDRIRRTIREGASPRHVPAKIVQVNEIPRTRSGKLVELAVRKVVHGEAVDNREALANPDALREFADRPELRD